MKPHKSEIADPVSDVPNEGRQSIYSIVFKSIFFWLLLISIVVALCEVSSYVAIKRIVPSRILARTHAENSIARIIHNRNIAEKPLIIQASAPGAQMETSALFHGVLGWDYPPGSAYEDADGVRYTHGPDGERRCLTDFNSTLVSTYGDSFTYCAEVGDGETWQTFLGEKLQTNVLNFGVSGYGPDQAMLKYELGRNCPAKVIMLCILPENINRVVNIYRPFYTHKDTIMGTKPMFLNRHGTIRLVHNPISHSAELSKLEQVEFLEELGKLDYWYQLDKRLPKFSFPYVFSLFSWKDVLYSQVEAGIDNLVMKSGRHPWNLYEEDGPFSIMCHIADRFTASVKAAGGEPLIVIMPHKDNITEVMDRGFRRTARFTEYLAAKGYPFLDGVKAVADMKPSKSQLERWYRGHAAAEGNRILANILSKRLKADFPYFSRSHE